MTVAATFIHNPNEESAPEPVVASWTHAAAAYVEVAPTPTSRRTREAGMAGFQRRFGDLMAGAPRPSTTGARCAPRSPRSSGMS